MDKLEKVLENIPAPYRPWKYVSPTGVANLSKYSYTGSWKKRKKEGTFVFYFLKTKVLCFKNLFKIIFFTKWLILLIIALTIFVFWKFFILENTQKKELFVSEHFWKLFSHSVKLQLKNNKACFLFFDNLIRKLLCLCCCYCCCYLK